MLGLFLCLAVGSVRAEYNFHYGVDVDLDQFDRKTKEFFDYEVGEVWEWEHTTVCLLSVNCFLGEDLLNQMKQCYIETNRNVTEFEEANEYLCQLDLNSQYTYLVRNFRVIFKTCGHKWKSICPEVLKTSKCINDFLIDLMKSGNCGKDTVGIEIPEGKQDTKGILDEIAKVYYY